jgi:hypothetical protein
MLVLVISAASATVPARKLHHVVRPIAALAMDGPRVAYVTDDDAVRVWNVQTGATAGLRPGSGHYMEHPFIPEVAIAGTRVAWITLGISGNSQETWARLYTSSLTSGARPVASAFRTDGYSDGGVQLWDGNWLTGLVGSGKVLAVSRWTTKPNADFSGNEISNARMSVIPATRKPLRMIASGEQSIVSASSDASRMAVLRPDDSVGIYSATGVLLRQIRPSSAKEIAYGGGRLAVLTDTKTLEVYDSRSGKLLHTWPIHTKRSYLQAGKLSAYGRIGLRRLAHQGDAAHPLGRPRQRQGTRAPSVLPHVGRAVRRCQAAGRRLHREHVSLWDGSKDGRDAGLPLHHQGALHDQEGRNDSLAASTAVHLSA